MIPISTELLQTIGEAAAASIITWMVVFSLSLFIAYAPADSESKAAKYSAILATIVAVIVFLFVTKVFVLVP